MNLYSIGDVSRSLGLSADTLRYYEKIKLLQKIARDNAGRRLYNEQDLSKLRFIQRAQKMNFSLAEIAQLLQMRTDPQHARDEVRLLTAQKLATISEHIKDLTVLRDELQLLSNLCRGSEGGCPIIEGIEHQKDKN